MINKLAIIMSGGGMSCSYSVGVICALVKEFKVTDPDIVIAGSGSSGTMAYYVAKQYQSIENIWKNLLSTKKFINIFRFWKIIDIDFLIDEVFKKEDPLNTKNISSSKINFLIPVTNCGTGEIKYFSNKDKVDIFEVLRAAKAMPLAFNKSVNINGTKYCDSSLSSSPELHILHAKELGATHIIVIDNNNSNPVTRWGFNTWLFLKDKKFKQNYLNIKKSIADSFIQPNIFITKPQSKLEISSFNNNRDLLVKTIELGYSDCKNNDDLKKFLKSFAKK